MTISFNRQTAELTVRTLREAWGGRLPTWEEFKLASKSGRVTVDKTVALQAINLQGMPRGPAVFYGVVTMWVAFLLAAFISPSSSLSLGAGGQCARGPLSFLTSEASCGC